MNKYTQQQIEDQFTKDLTPPDITKRYIVNETTKTTGVTLLMKCALLSKKYPHLLYAVIDNDIELDLEKETTGTWKGKALHLAINSEYAMYKLLKNKANINAKDSSGFTILMYASQNNNFTESIMQMIIEAKINLDLQNNNGDTALIMAAISSNTSGENPVKILIEAKSNLEIKNVNGDNALILASWKASDLSSVDTVKNLIEGNANINALNNNRVSPLSAATSIKSVIENKSVIKILTDAKADINMQDIYGNTALMNCVDSDEILKILINAGADVYLKNKRNETVLDKLFDHDKKSPLIDFLLEKDISHDKKLLYVKKEIIYKRRLSEKEVTMQAFQKGLTLPEGLVVSYL